MKRFLSELTTTTKFLGKIEEFSFETLTEYFMRMISNFFSVDKVSLLRYNQDNGWWTLISSTGIMSMSGQSYVLRDITSLDDMKIVLCPTEGIGYDAFIIFQINTTWWALAIDDTSQSRRFIDDVENLRIIGFFLKRALRLKINFIQLREASERRVAIDALTGLPNRRALEDKLQEIKAEDELTIVVIDVDNFKRVNDTFGHTKGDRVLKIISEEIRKAGEKNADIFSARFGGEEFVMIIPTDSFRRIIMTIRTNIRERFAPSWPLTFSSGSCPLIAGINPATCINAADFAMYAAKKRGKDRHVAVTKLEVVSRLPEIVGHNKTVEEVIELLCPI